MTRLTIRAVCLLGFLAAAPGLSGGCATRGPAERAGQSLDRGVQDVKDAVTPPGPVERAGRAVDRTVNP